MAIAVTTIKKEKDLFNKPFVSFVNKHRTDGIPEIGIRVRFLKGVAVDYISFIDDITNPTTLKSLTIKQFIPMLYAEDEKADISSFSIDDVELIRGLVPTESLYDSSLSVSTELYMSYKIKVKDIYLILYFTFILRCDPSDDIIKFLISRLAYLRDELDKDQEFITYDYKHNRTVAFYLKKYLLPLDNLVIRREAENENTFLISRDDERLLLIDLDQLNILLEYKKNHLSEEDYRLIEMAMLVGK